MSERARNITVVGAGLAGSEAALVLSRVFSRADNSSGVNTVVNLVEMRPHSNTPVHSTDMPAELVCSNSFKSMKPNSAAGMLKRELELLRSPVYDCALKTKVDAGGALAVDRHKFSEQVEKMLSAAPNIKICRREVISIAKELQKADAVILATGPMTSDALAADLAKLTGEEHMAFYDAAAPIVEADTIDYDIVFSQDRYGLSCDKSIRSCNKKIQYIKDDKLEIEDIGNNQLGDYLNCPMNKEEYELFINELLKADTVIIKDFETSELFSACQPVEEIARRGFDAPRFGALKPVGLTDPRTGKRPYAVVQLRSENANNTAYNLVGFQTNLKFGEQKRIFRMIPGLANAEFSRYGVMHRNTFINSPKLLDSYLKLKNLVFDDLEAEYLCDSDLENLGALGSENLVTENLETEYSRDLETEKLGTQNFGQKNFSTINNNTDIANSSNNLHKSLYIAGQLSGTEGYLEAVRSGHHAAICAAAEILGKQTPALSNETVFGALLDYATDPETKNYQPMHVNFGILPPLEKREKNKRMRYTKYAERGETAMTDYVEHLKEQDLL